MKNQRVPKPALGGKAVSRRTYIRHFVVHGEGKGRGKPLPLGSREKKRKRAGVGSSSIPPVAQGLVGLFVCDYLYYLSYEVLYDFLYDFLYVF